MKQKELKNLAKKIALMEKKLSTTSDKKEQRELQNAIITLSNKIKIDNMEELFLLDELIQDFLEKE